MKKVKEIVSTIWSLSYMKYILVCVVGVLVVGFIDQNSWLSHVNNMERIDELKAEINHYEALNQQNKNRIHELQVNPKAIEKIARERYFMKADDEDVFVLSDDVKPEREKIHETVE
jgi:cell division protein FtsB